MGENTATTELEDYQESPLLSTIRDELRRLTFSTPSTSQVERMKRGGLHALKWLDLSVVGMGLVCIVWASTQLFMLDPLGQASQPIEPLVIFFVVAMSLAYIVGVGRLRTRLSRGIGSSGLLHCLAEGPEAMNEFHRAVPFPWNTVFARPVENMRSAVRSALVAADWYISRPAILVHWTWVALAAGIVLFVTGFTIAVIDLVTWSSLSRSSTRVPSVAVGPSNSMLLIFVGQFLLMMYQAYWQASKEIVARYLRDTLEIRGI